MLILVLCELFVCLPNFLLHFFPSLLFSFLVLSFLSTKPRDWLGRTSPKCQVLLNQSFSWMNWCLIAAAAVSNDDDDAVHERMNVCDNVDQWRMYCAVADQFGTWNWRQKWRHWDVQPVSMWVDVLCMIVTNQQLQPWISRWVIGSHWAAWV